MSDTQREVLWWFARRVTGANPETVEALVQEAIRKLKAEGQETARCPTRGSRPHYLPCAKVKGHTGSCYLWDERRPLTEDIPHKHPDWDRPEKCQHGPEAMCPICDPDGSRMAAYNRAIRKPEEAVVGCLFEREGHGLMRRCELPFGHEGPHVIPTAAGPRKFPRVKTVVERHLIPNCDGRIERICSECGAHQD